VVSILIVLLAAADIPKEFEILGIHIETENAYGFVVAIFDCLLLVFFKTCWKAGDLLKACEGAEADRAIAAVFHAQMVAEPILVFG
jgi:hypothetical protein